jgi:LemA protein
MVSFLVLLGIVVLLLFWGIGIYNTLVSFRNRYKNGFSQIDVQLKRRYDLIPNLVETAKGYIEHERETLEAVIAARNQAVTSQQNAALNPGNPDLMNQLSGAEGQLTGALGRLFAVAENYPELKASQTMSQLMEELSSTENKISFARQAFNDSVMSYNIEREKFPNSLIANAFAFQEAQLLESTTRAEEREAPKVTF